MEMYYKRVISNELQRLLMIGGELHWLYKLVKERKDFDFLIVANNSNEKILVYRGTTKLLDISLKRGLVRISAHAKYIDLAHENNLDIYGDRNLSKLDFEDDFVKLVFHIPSDKHYDNRKEGYFQTQFSRQFGIDSRGDEDFVVLDKEAVIGYRDMSIKNKNFGPQKDKFRAIKKYLSEIDEKKYGKNLSREAMGNELDFLAINRSGDIILIEFKHGSSAKGVYLSPIQIGLYFSIFQDYICRNKPEFINTLCAMIKQKKTMGLISPNFPDANFTGKIVPMLVIAQFNPKSSAFKKLGDVLQICREKIEDNTWLSHLEVYEYDEHKKLMKIRY